MYSSLRVRMDIKVAGFIGLCMGGIAKGRCAGRVEVLKATVIIGRERENTQSIWSNFLELLTALAGRSLHRYS